ncbi:hypothetical protein ITP53_17475 [Nonomuraea sp. K274]|uniref:Uncharacterized protein n=1 Tax=Nonomuraea cypriaca TaxID=1187855 RepID=A0A931F1H8_9ACTN|nr:hypothetical protein [Nonomuraea cypriaca]MBF8187493.1 hypothetical protein [Nonomuraea cypriaca]
MDPWWDGAGDCRTRTGGDAPARGRRPATADRATALAGSGATPPGTLGGAGHDLDACIGRLATLPRGSWPMRPVLAVALTVVSAPLSLFLLPL